MNSYPYECKIGVRCFCSHFHCLCCFVVVVARFLLPVQDVGRCLVLYFTYRLIRVQVEFASIVIITMHASWSLFYHMYFVQLIAHKRNGNSAGKRGIPSRERQEKKNIIWKILIIIWITEDYAYTIVHPSTVICSASSALQMQSKNLKWQTTTCDSEQQK